MTSIPELLDKDLGGWWYEPRSGLYIDRTSARVVRARRVCGCQIADCSCWWQYTLYDCDGRRTVKLRLDYSERQRTAGRIVSIIERRLYTDGDKINGRSLIGEIRRVFHL